MRRAFRLDRDRAWRPESLNGWIGWGFVAGSFLFVSGSVLSLRPHMATALSLSEWQINAVFFLGSIFFTLAAYLQLFQAANSGNPEAIGPRPTHRVPIGWMPGDIGWLGSFLQFIGTLLFNVSTAMALGEAGSWLRADLTIWVPDIFGSILFLLSGYLAFMEASGGYWAWRMEDLSWWVVLVNLGGCLAFMVSAIYAFVPSAGAFPDLVHASVVWTLMGAVGFLIGSGLMLAEGSAGDAAA